MGFLHRSVRYYFGLSLMYFPINAHFLVLSNYRHSHITMWVPPISLTILYITLKWNPYPMKIILFMTWSYIWYGNLNASIKGPSSTFTKQDWFHWWDFNIAGTCKINHLLHLLWSSLHTCALIYLLLLFVYIKFSLIVF